MQLFLAVYYTTLDKKWAMINPNGVQSETFPPKKDIGRRGGGLCKR